MEGRLSMFFKLSNTMFEKGSVEVCKLNDNLCHFNSQLFDNNCIGNYALAVYSFFLNLFIGIDYHFLNIISYTIYYFF